VCCGWRIYWVYIGILLGAHPILYISRIRVKTPETERTQQLSQQVSKAVNLIAIVWIKFPRIPFVSVVSEEPALSVFKRELPR
jgi:hypothetical protein